MTDPSCIRFDRAAEQLGVDLQDLLDHVIDGRLRPALSVPDGVEYRAVVTDVVYPNGAADRLVLPPGLVPEGGSPTVPPGLFKLTPETVRGAVRGGTCVYAIEDDDGDVYRLSDPFKLGVTDVVLCAEEWQTFIDSWGHGPCSEAEPSSQPAPTSASELAVKATPGRSRRDADRLTLGADAVITIRRAAELLPGDDTENRRIITEAGIARVIRAAGEGGGRKNALQGVRWGDVLSLFPTASEARETERLDREREIQRDLDAQPKKPRRKSRARKGGVRLADL